jgi:hypothetical protein
VVEPEFFTDIIEYSRWSIVNPYNGMDYLVMRFPEAVFLKDFGPWKKGHKAYTLTFYPFMGSLQETNNFDEVVNYCKVSLHEETH